MTVDIMMTSAYVQLYQKHPAVNNIIPYNQKYLFRNPLRFLFLINRLRKNNYDAVFSSNNPDAFSVSQGIFNRLITKNRSVGFDWKESSKLYSDVIRGDTTVHYAKSQYDLWRYFDKNAEFQPPKLYYLGKSNVRPQKSILFWLGATGNKILNESLLNSIIQEIKNLNINFQLALGPHDEHIKELYTSSWKDHIQTIHLDLKGIARYFLEYKCVIMPDTGPMHLVAALGIPLVQVFIDSNIQQYAYTGPGKFIIDKKLDAVMFSKFLHSWIS